MPSIANHNVTELERAFQLASSGRYASMADIRKQLLLDGYSDNQITGKGLARQLQALIQTARRAPTRRDEAFHILPKRRPHARGADLAKRQHTHDGVARKSI